MTEQVHGRPAAPALSTPHCTVLNPFFRSNSEGQSLFSVCQGVPATDALEQASCLLATALATGRVAAMGADSEGTGEVMWAAVHLMEAAKAVVDSVVEAEFMEQHPATAQDREAASLGLHEALADLLDQVKASPGGNLFTTGLATKALEIARKAGAAGETDHA
jgi:DUF3077 family protein